MEALSIPDEILISRFLAPYANQKTRMGYARTLYAWLGFMTGARLHILQAERLHIEQWAKMLAHEGASKATVAGKLSPVCAFYRWATEEGLIDYDIAQFVRRPSRPRRSNLKWLTAEQLANLLAASIVYGPPLSGFVHLTGLNGLRLTETLEARIEHLGEQDGLTTLWLPNRKGGVMDTVSLPEATVKVLVGCIRNRERGLILTGGHGQKLKPGDVYRMLDQVRDDGLGIDFPIRPHMLRATFVTLSLDAGIPARDIIASAGWATTSMLQYYDRAHAAIRRNASHRLTDYISTTNAPQSTTS